MVIVVKIQGIIVNVQRYPHDAAPFWHRRQHNTCCCMWSYGDGLLRHARPIEIQTRKSIRDLPVAIIRDRASKYRGFLR